VKKLYKITIPGECYVWASDEDDALCEGASIGVSDFSFESGFEPIVEEVKAEHKVDKEWSVGIPFGKPDDEFYEFTMKDILKKMKKDSKKKSVKK
jgi:hypothetical protein